jgi:hypothetical protein
MNHVIRGCREYTLTDVRDRQCTTKRLPYKLAFQACFAMIIVKIWP